jgi:hypothetical protein
MRPHNSNNPGRTTASRTTRRDRRRTARAFLPLGEAVEDRTLLSTDLWTGAAGDNIWDNATNWVNSADNTDHHVPTATDAAVIDNTYTDVSGVTINADGTDSVHSLQSLAALSIAGGSLSIASASTANGGLSVSNGTLTLNGSLAINGPLSVGPLSTLSGSGALDVYGGADISSHVTISGVALNNHAGSTATWHVNIGDGTGISLVAGASINNLAGATFAVVDVFGGAAIGGDATAVFNNAGTLTSSAHGATIGVPFNNTGSVSVTAGSLALGADAPGAGGTSSGSFAAAAGTTLRLLGEALTPASSVASSGAVRLSNTTEAGSYSAGSTYANDVAFTGPVLALGDLEVNGAVSFAPATGGPVTLTTGALTVDFLATLTSTDGFVVDGPFAPINRSTVSVAGAIDVYGGMTLRSNDTFSGVALNNHAGSAATWIVNDDGTGAGVSLVAGASINNLAGATFAVADVFGGAAIGGDATAVFNNAGTLTSAAHGAIGIAFNNSGSVAIQAGSMSLGNTKNSGTVSVANGALLSASGYTQSTGSTVLTGGTLSGGPFAFNGGTLSGSGTVNGNVTSGGQVIPGGTGAIGQLTVNGSYSQTSSGSLNVEIGSGGSDLLVVSGPAALGGSVNIADLTSTALPLGTVFTVMTFPSATGSFAAYNGLGINNQEILSPALNSTSLTLTVVPSSSLSGVVFADFNDDGQVDFGEQGIPNVPITLAGTDDLGHAVSLSQTTDGDGTYVFQNLRPGIYTITETQQPAGYTPGINSVGTGGGTASGAQFTGIVLAAGENAMNYNYGEVPTATGAVHSGLAAGIGFWNNRNGQALIKALNGGTGTQLGDWLAATFPHMFGAQAGGSDLAGESNASVASFFQSRFVVHGQKLDAQVLATALAVYVTDPTLDSTGVGRQYGFLVGGTGLATTTDNVGSNGAAFGVANNTTMTVMGILLAADAQAVDGVLYGGDTTKRTKANTVFSAINEAGGL